MKTPGGGGVNWELNREMYSLNQADHLPTSYIDNDAQYWHCCFSQDSIYQPKYITKNSRLARVPIAPKLSPTK